MELHNGVIADGQMNTIRKLLKGAILRTIYELVTTSNLIGNQLMKTECNYL